MAPNGSLYLPDLSRLFAGEEQIIAWFDVPLHTWNASQLAETTVHYWKAIFDNERVRTQLYRSTPYWDSPNPTSQRHVDQATAAINVSASSDTHYDINEIKKDASFMSDALKICEQQALRVVLLEWQTRPKLHLQAGYSEAEIASLKDVYGAPMAFDADFESSTFRLRDEDEFKSETARRRRQIFIHFQECIGLARTWLALQDAKMAAKLGLKTSADAQPSFPTIGSNIEACIDLLVSTIEDLATGPQWDVIDDDSNYVWQVGHLFHTKYLMQVVMVAVRSIPVVPPSCVHKWFKIMGDVVYLSDVNPSLLMSQAQAQELGNLTALTTLTFIDPACTMQQLDHDPSRHWLHDLDLVSEVQQNLFNAIDAECMQAVPAAFAWGLVLQKVREDAIEAKDKRDGPIVQRAIDTYDTATGRRSSMPGSMQPSLFEDIVDSVLAVSPVADPITVIIRHTTEALGVADILATILQSPGTNLLPAVRLARSQIVQELVIISTSYLPDGDRYGPIVLTPQCALLEPRSTSLEDEQEVIVSCQRFVGIEKLILDVFDVAAARFPYESLPFLRLCRLLARGEIFQSGTQYVTHRLQTLNSFTHISTGDFGEYRTIDEEENANRVSLLQTLYAFPPDGNPLLTQGQDTSTTLILPADTIGEVISAAEPAVVRWAINYSGFPLIGEWLERHFNGTLFEILPAYESPTEVASELILLLTNLLLSTSSPANETPDRSTAIENILHESSTNLSFGTDIVSRVFDMLEQELQAYRRRPSSTFDTSVLSATLAFARAILNVRPTRFWQHVSKTSLVDPHGGNSLLYMVISGVESLSGNAAVTEASSLLYRDLITASLRKSNDAPERQWRATPHSGLLGSNARIYDVVLRGMTQNMLSIFESMAQWKPLRYSHAVQLLLLLSENFTRLLQYRYSVGSAASKLTSCLEMAAELILDRLRPETAGDVKIGSIVAHLLPSVDLTPSLSRSPEDQDLRQSLFRLCGVVINVAKAQKLPPAGFEPCLLDMAPILARNLELHQTTTSWLLQSLLGRVVEQRSVSLLGHLGTASSIDFLNLLCSETLCDDPSRRLHSWQLLTALISKDQQWLSVVLLTGSIPDRQGKLPSDKSCAYRGKLIADRAINLLYDIESVSATREGQHLLKKVLRFMIVAQQNWSWTMNTIRLRQDVFVALCRYAAHTKDQESAASSARRNTLVALITDVTSVHLQYAKSVRDIHLMRVFRPLLEWLTLHATDVASYNTSLHTNLAKNFNSRFGLDLDDFRTNRLTDAEDDDYYHLDVLDFVLNDNGIWKATGLKSQNTNQSYRAEVERANENLKLVESEVVLLSSFGNLCVEHAVFFAEDDGIRKIMAHVSQRCLEANSKKYPDERLFDNLVKSRTEMVLALVQQLVAKRSHGSDYTALLKPAWEAVMNRNSSYEAAIVNDDLGSWRTGLMVVLLTLQFHLGTGWKPLTSSTPNAADLLKHTTSFMPQIIEIATVVIGDGLNTVVSTLQEQKQAKMQQAKVEHIDVGLKDISLILNVLETLLRMARLPEFNSQLSDRLIATDTTDSAMRLYMWAHLLADDSTDNDPTHAEFAVRLLVSLSALPLVAEEMAVQGVITTILTARVTQVLQNIPEGVASLDSRPHCRSLYTIWAAGLLPLSLNLLHAVRGPVAGEISTFLNAFPHQLSRASRAFQPRDGSFITLQLSKEISTTSLVSFILDDYRSAGASAAVDPTLIRALAGFDEHKKTLVNDLGAHIALDGPALTAKIVPTTEEEAKELAGAKGILAQKVRMEMASAVMCLSPANEDSSTSTGQK